MMVEKQNIRGRDLVFLSDRRAVAWWMRKKHGYDFVISQAWGLTRTRTFGSYSGGDARVCIMVSDSEPVKRRTEWAVGRLARRLRASEVVRVS